MKHLPPSVFCDLTKLSHVSSLSKFLAPKACSGKTVANGLKTSSENVSSQSHLQGCYSLLASRHIHLTTDLLSAGYWNYLREDITVALIEQRGLMITLSDQNAPSEPTEDADFANHITFLLGKIINRCLSVDSQALTPFEWEAMKSDLDKWKSSLPSSFDTIQTPELGKQRNFPSIWAIRSWHGENTQPMFPSASNFPSFHSPLLPYRHGNSMAGPACRSTPESSTTYQ